MAEEHLNTDLGTIYYLWKGDGRENEGIDILATACKKAVTDVSFCYVVAGGRGGGGGTDISNRLSFTKYK